MHRIRRKKRDDKMTTETRLEADSIGTMEVPAEAYYGVQALRAKQNFPITGTSFIRYLSGTWHRLKKQQLSLIIMQGFFRRIRQMPLSEPVMK